MRKKANIKCHRITGIISHQIKTIGGRNPIIMRQHGRKQLGHFKINGKGERQREFKFKL
jgi:hypothetical protein